MYDTMITTNPAPERIQALRFHDGSVAWALEGEVEGKYMDLQSVCCDPQGRVYIADSYNRHLLLLNGQTGQLLQVIETEEIGSINIRGFA